MNFTPHPEIHAEVLPCATCSGKGERLKVDPLDLKLFRDKTCKLPLAAFRRGIRNPNTGRPPSIGFLFLVEQGKRACPLWLYEAYVQIPEREWDRRKRATGEQLKEYRRAAAEKNLSRYLDLFVLDEVLTRTDVSRRLNVPYKTARLYLGKLVAAGELIETRHENAPYTYMLAHPERIRR